MRLATLSSNLVSDFMCGQYSCVGDVAKGARVSAGSTLKDWVKNIDFFSKGIDFKASLPFDQAWSRAYKNEVP